MDCTVCSVTNSWTQLSNFHSAMPDKKGRLLDLREDRRTMKKNQTVVKNNQDKKDLRVNERFTVHLEIFSLNKHRGHIFFFPGIHGLSKKGKATMQ